MHARERSETLGDVYMTYGHRDEADYITNLSNMAAFLNGLIRGTAINLQPNKIEGWPNGGQSMARQITPPKV